MALTNFFSGLEIKKGWNPSSNGIQIQQKKIYSMCCHLSRLKKTPFLFFNGNHIVLIQNTNIFTQTQSPVRL